MPQRLHLISGGELASPPINSFGAVAARHIARRFPHCATARPAWQAAAPRIVDKAHLRYFIANIHRMREASRPGSETGPMTT